MIAGVKEGEVTEMHDISWESVASSNVIYLIVFLSKLIFSVENLKFSYCRH